MIYELEFPISIKRFRFDPFLKNICPSMNKMDEKQNSWQLFQAKCPKERDFPQGGDKMVVPTMFL
jgi:hypothetical protein